MTYVADRSGPNIGANLKDIWYREVKPQIEAGRYNLAYSLMLDIQGRMEAFGPDLITRTHCGIGVFFYVKQILRVLEEGKEPEGILIEGLEVRLAQTRLPNSLADS